MFSATRILCAAFISVAILPGQQGKLLPLDPKAPSTASNAIAGALQPQITYHTGPVMLGTVKMYYIYYGDWTAPAEVTSRAILESFASSIGGSPYYGINTSYTQGIGGTAVSNSVSFVPATSVFDNPPSLGAANIGSNVVTIIQNAINILGMPADPNAVYFVLIAPNIIETSGFCGYHDRTTIQATDIKYAVIPNKKNQNLGFCSAQTVSSPNNNAAADSMVNVIAHELSEAVTDPHLDAWYDSSGEENADKCKWTFGHTYTLLNGSLANIRLGGKDYMIQQNWANDQGGYCTMSLTTPVLTGVTSAIGYQGSSAAYFISGFNLTGATIIPIPGVTVTSITTTPNLITASLSISVTAPTGPINLGVVSPGGEYSGPIPFTISAPPPLISQILPPSGLLNSTLGVTILGTNLDRASINTGAYITASGVTANPSSISATFTILPGAPLGPQLITVTTAGGTSNALPFTIGSVAPILANINPPGGNAGLSVPVTITGNNLTLASLTVGGGIVVSNLTSSATSINAIFNIPSVAPSGPVSVVANTVGGVSNPLSFNINAGPPVLTGINPPSGVTGAAVPVILSGGNLGGATLNTSPGLTASGVSSNATSISAVLFAPAPGTYTINASTANGVSNPVTFTVNSPIAGPPALTSVTPSGGAAGSTISVNITGTNFQPGTAILMACAGLSVSNINIVSNSQILALFSISPAPDRRCVFSVLTSAGQSNSLSFDTTLPPAPSGPVITSINPPSAPAGAALPVLISGSNLTGAVITPIVGVTISNMSVSPNQITATFSVSPTATLGARAVLVTTPNGVSNPITFTVTTLMPSLFAITPPTGVIGATVPVTITGANLSGATINAISGIAFNNVAASANQITADFIIAGGASIGLRNVTVTTANGSSNAVVFQVTGTSSNAVLTGISPPNANQGASGTVVLTGNNLSGATIGPIPGVTITNLLTSATAVSATFTIAIDAPLGLANVFVVTPSGFSNAVGFTIDPVRDRR